jgi:hypothetical protein
MELVKRKEWSHQSPKRKVCAFAVAGNKKATESAWRAGKVAKDEDLVSY